MQVSQNNKCVVHGNLKIEETPIKSLPVDLIIKEYLDLYKTDIAELSENLLIEGNFYSTISIGPYGVKIDEIAATVVIKGRNGGCSL